MDEQQLLQQVDAFIAENQQAIVEDIARLVAVRSVEEPAAGPGKPFGAGPRKALDTALEMARGMGFETNDGDGYVGWAQLPGQQAGHVATITHVDIVPEGDGWDDDPLVLRQRDGWLLGRGVADDKGPSVLCLYMAKFFKQQGTPLRYGLRVLLGCNEESGMGDVDYYLQHQPQPLFCFSPDSDFPVCNAEKGITSGNIVSPVLNGNLVGFTAGLASNVIPKKAVCVVKGSLAGLPQNARITATLAGEGLVRLEAAGIGGHAAHPAGTLNAIGLLVGYLLESGLAAPGAETAFLTLLQKLHHATDGSGLGIAASDDIFSPLTCIGGMLALENGVLTQNINIRFPTSITGTEIARRIGEAAAPLGAQYLPDAAHEPYHISADSAPIQALLQAYNTVTGKPAKTYTMGGGTYARHFANAVSFGPADGDMERPAFAGPEHGANEGSSLQQLLTALKVYILAIAKLQQLEL